MTIKQHPQFSIEDTDILNKKIWRYMKIEHLFHLLGKKELYFARSDLLGDKFEGSFTLTDYEWLKKEKELKRINTPKEIIEQIQKKKLPDPYKLFRKYIYINCWHINSNENNLMWSNYTIAGKGIAIETTIKKLIESIKDEDLEFLLGLVKYVDYKKDSILGNNFFNPFFSKHQEFSLENEFRIAIYFLSEMDIYDKRKIDKGKSIKVDLDPLIKSIIYSAQCNKKDIYNVMKLTEKLNIRNKVVKSSLAEDPLFP